MILPPAVTIHGLAHARAALEPSLPVTLLSAPGAASYAGCGWWRALVQAVSAGRDSVPDVLDCGDAPGRVLEGLSVGCKLLILQPCPAYADVAERATRVGARVIPDRPPSLDMRQRGAARRLTGWLRHRDTSSPIG